MLFFVYVNIYNIVNKYLHLLYLIFYIVGVIISIDLERGYPMTNENHKYYRQTLIVEEIQSERRTIIKNINSDKKDIASYSTKAAVSAIVAGMGILGGVIFGKNLGNAYFNLSSVSQTLLDFEETAITLCGFPIIGGIACSVSNITHAVESYDNLKSNHKELKRVNKELESFKK